MRSESGSGPTATLNSTDISCHGANDGTATVNASSGTPPYSYEWSSGDTLATVSNLSAGTYTVIVTDADNCSDTVTAVITEPDSLLITLPQLPPICEGATATLTTQTTGGTQPYSYFWNTTDTLPNIAVTAFSNTTYSVTVTDSQGCTDSASVFITVHPLSVTFTADTFSGCPLLCVTFTNITPNSVSSIWNFGDGTTSSSVNPVHCYSTGVYTVSVQVTDSNNCSNTSTVQNMITVFPEPVAAFTATPQPTSILDPVIYFKDLSIDASSLIPIPLGKNKSLIPSPFGVKVLGI